MLTREETIKAFECCSCLDCKRLKGCLESSRRYPCRDFKLAEPAILERRGRKHDSKRKA